MRKLRKGWWRVVATIPAVVLLALALNACSTGTVTAEPSGDGAEVSDGSYGGSVSIVEVPDGDGTVRCAVLVGYSKGGISCDWNDEE